MDAFGSEPSNTSAHTREIPNGYVSKASVVSPYARFLAQNCVFNNIRTDAILF